MASTLSQESKESRQGRAPSPAEVACIEAASLPAGALGASPRIPTHADARGIDHGQQHVFATLMGLRARFAEPALLVVDTLRADRSGRFATHSAGDQRGSIPAEHFVEPHPHTFLARLPI